MNADLYSELHENELQIRLLVIMQSQEFDSILKCSVHTVPLPEAPRYCALSYLWGDGKITDKILINEVELLVPVNLIFALRQLRAFQLHSFMSHGPESDIKRKQDTPETLAKRKLDLPLYLWADAICINQENQKERASQVKLMGKIYQYASKVLAWLGPEAERSARAIAAILLIANEVPQTASQHDIYSWLRRYPEIFGVPDAWQAIRSLWRREYWRRTWMVQELVLNDKILLLCGTSFFNWRDLERFEGQAQKIRSTEPAVIPKIAVTEHIDCIILLRRFWRDPSGQGHSSRFYPLIQARRTHATDLRDKVYGVLGLTKLAIDADYSRPVSEVYVETAIEFLQQEGLNYCFGNAGNGLRNIPDLPSWVPDWSFQRWLGFECDRWKGIEIVPSDDEQFRIDRHHPRILHVSGFPVACVEELGPVLPKSGTESNATVCFTQFIKGAIGRYAGRELAKEVPTIQAMLRLILTDADILSPEVHWPRLQIPSPEFFNLAIAFLKILCYCWEERSDATNYNWTENIPKLGIASDQSFTADFCEQFLGDTSILSPWNSFEDAIAAIDDGLCHRLMTLVARIFVYNQLFYTDESFAGYGPSDVKTNDIVFALKGCKMPLILRKIDTYYELVGPSVIPGIMDGELFKHSAFKPTYQHIEIR